MIARNSQITLFGKLSNRWYWFCIDVWNQHYMEQRTETKTYPFYIKAPATLLGLVLFTMILRTLDDVLVPLAFSVLIAILLNPLCTRLEQRLPKVPAIVLSVLIMILVIVGLFYFLSTQIAGFASSIPLIKQKSATLLVELQNWAELHFGINIQDQVTALTNGLNNGNSLLINTFGTIMGTISVVVLIPIYIFMLLYYKPLILDFLFQVFSEKHSLRVAEILSETKAAVQSFMIGLMIETLIVCVMNSIALVLIGVPSAIVIGVLKIIFDRIEDLKPWGRLLGDEVPTEHMGIEWQKRWQRIFRKMQKKKEMEESIQAETESQQGLSPQEPGQA